MLGSLSYVSRLIEWDLTSKKLAIGESWDKLIFRPFQPFFQPFFVNFDTVSLCFIFRLFSVTLNQFENFNNFCIIFHKFTWFEWIFIVWNVKISHFSPIFHAFFTKFSNPSLLLTSSTSSLFPKIYFKQMNTYCIKCKKDKYIKHWKEPKQ